MPKDKFSKQKPPKQQNRGKLTHQEHNHCSLTTIYGWYFPAGHVPNVSKCRQRRRQKKGWGGKKKDLVLARLTKFTLSQVLKKHYPGLAVRQDPLGTKRVLVSQRLLRELCLMDSKLPRRANACFYEVIQHVDILQSKKAITFFACIVTIPVQLKRLVDPVLRVVEPFVGQGMHDKWDNAPTAGIFKGKRCLFHSKLRR